VVPAPAAPKQSFHVRAEFRAPLEFVFAWCTDYRSDDARREKDRYTRRILERSPHRVVFEDLGDDNGGGWWWSRHEVALRPPDRWASASVGSHQTLELDYRLTRLGLERTRLDLTWTRRTSGLGPARVARGAIERATTTEWKNFADALEKDYRTSRRPRRR
jgi:hypothetical protein